MYIEHHSVLEAKFSPLVSSKDKDKAWPQSCHCRDVLSEKLCMPKTEVYSKYHTFNVYELISDWLISLRRIVLCVPDKDFI